MAEVKLTKNELRSEQNRLTQLKTYLPTLQLKKAMLQIEVNEARLEIVKYEEEFITISEKVKNFTPLLTEKLKFDIRDLAKIKEIKRRYENIAGVEVPYLDTLVFFEFDYDLFDTPPWVDVAALNLQALVEASIRVKIAREKKEALEKELQEVSIRVNLFEKILIPRSLKNIKKIKIFLADQQLAAVSQAKVAKTKIEEKKELLSHAS